MEERIVFFDGVCNLCNSTVDFLVRIDKKEKLKFASLQGETASKVLSDLDQENLGTIVYYTPSKQLKQSTAVLTILKDVGGVWGLLYGFMIVPRPIRDFFYRLVARNRYRWFGKKDTCRMPTPAERARFLD